MMMNAAATRATRAMALCALASTFIATATATAQNQLWLKQFGSVEGDAANALAPDGAGGMMVAGFTNGDMGGLSAGAFDAYLARFDSAGHQLWVRQFGTNGFDRPEALAIDGTGGVFVAGWTEDYWNLPAIGHNDAFVAHFGSEGDRLWIRRFSSGTKDMANALAPDTTGGFYIAGRTKGDLGGTNLGSYDIFLARYDSAGNRLWIRQFGTDEPDMAEALTPDGAGGVYIGGLTYGDLGEPNAGFNDAFVARYDSAGNQLWLRQFGSSGGDRIHALAPDGAGGVMIAGKAGPNLAGPTAGLAGILLGRFDDEGNELWIRQFGGSSSDVAAALASDGFGGMIVGGSTWQASMGGPFAGLWDAFVARCDSDGNQLWLRQFGTDANDGILALALDGAGTVQVGGMTVGSLGRPNPNGAQGANDAILARYTIDSCYADCDHTTGAGGGNGVLDIFDFLCWQNDFVIGNSYACDCDMSTGPLVCDMLDFLCFQDAFVSGCP